MNRALNVSFHSARNRFVCAARTTIEFQKVSSTIQLQFSIMRVIFSDRFFFFFQWDWDDEELAWSIPSQNDAILVRNRVWESNEQRVSSWCCDHYNTSMADRASAKWCHVVTKCCNVCLDRFNDIRARTNSLTHTHTICEHKSNWKYWRMFYWITLFWIFILILNSSTAK